MFYNENNEWHEIKVKATDTLPIGTEVDYNGTDVPDGWEEVEDTVTRVLKVIYPVGAIYTSTNNTNPKDMFGFGTWEQIKDTFLLTAGDTYKAGNTGGAASQSYTPAGENTGTAVTMNAVSLSHSGGAVGGHILTIDEIPSHSHTRTVYVYYGAGGLGHTEDTQIMDNGSVEKTFTSTTSSVGKGGSHNHGFTQPSAHSFTPTTKSITQPTFTGTAATINTLPPYLVVYAWKRTS